MKFDAQDWPVISALFDQVVDLPLAQRSAWLENLPEGQRAHRRTLEVLLADHAHVQTRDFMHSLPKVGLSADSRDEFKTVAPDDGERLVGPYRLLREIGRGGMGSVWLAERTDGLLKRQVALKLPHLGLATRVFAERLARERDILASLAHPHIASLYDAGVTAAGQPYIALAYVQGHTLIEHCRTQALGVRERIGLFQQVLEAVQYAHAHLVIHRDLKPSNVLVDEQGQVHLLDFGIAKLLVDGQAEATELTLEAGQALTPDYASPEQIAGTAISTASDVYSLGVLLYEVLAGVRPYRLQRQASATLEQALLEIEVPRPSAAARNAGDLPTARALRGDLDTIVLKALQKDPAQRYATADAFGQDLQRHLDGEPVQARPDALTYRVGKFVRRHRVGVAAGVLAALALGVGVASTAWQARRANQQAQRAQAVQDFLIGLFNESDPAKAQGRQVTARELLDRGQRELQTKLADQPALSAELHGVLANLYAVLGEEQRALPLAQSQCDTVLKLHGSQSVEYGDALYLLADVHNGMRNTEAAYKTFEMARSVLRLHKGERLEKLLLIDAHMAFDLTDLGRAAEGYALFDAVLPKMQAHFGAASWEVLAHRAHMASSYPATGDYLKAVAVYREIEPLLEHIDAAHALDASDIRFMGGHVMLVSWLPEEAEPLLRNALAEVERLVGVDTSIAVQIERELALALTDRGRYAEAAKMVDANVRRAQRALGEGHLETRLSEMFGVQSLIMVGRGADAESMTRRALRGAAQVPGMTDTRLLGLKRRLAMALIFDGKANEGLALMQEVATHEVNAGATHGYAHGGTLMLRAAAQASLGQLQVAAVDAVNAERAIQDEPSPRDVDWFLPRAYLTHAMILARMGQGAAANALIDQAQSRLQRFAMADHPIHLMLQLARAEALRADGRNVDADRLDRQARQRLSVAFGVVLPRTLPLLVL